MLNSGDSGDRSIGDMPLHKMDQERFRQGIGEAGYTSRRGHWVWAKDWAVLGVALTAVAALVAITIGVMILAMSERKQLTALRSQTEDRLSSFDRELSALGAGVGQLIASNEASKPDFSKRFLDMLNENIRRAIANDDPILAMETATAITRKARELRINSDQEHIAAAGRDFLRLVSSETRPTPAYDRLSAPAMEAVAELIGYRSFLLPNPLGQPQDGIAAHSAMLMLPKFHGFKPLDSESRIYGYMRSLAMGTAGTGAKLDILNRSESILAAEPYAAVMVDGYDLKIDGLDAHNVVFRNCRITYSGSQLTLDNVYFTNCTFQMDRSGRDFARAALSASGQVTFGQR
ncbi:MAG: hypothetical protein LAQ69_34745 [Acidobacteriia bacterium]|nr:hypothetical protein [Terriglobia bacterium]